MNGSMMLLSGMYAETLLVALNSRMKFGVSTYSITWSDGASELNFQMWNANPTAREEGDGSLSLSRAASEASGGMTVSEAGSIKEEECEAKERPVRRLYLFQLFWLIASSRIFYFMRRII